MSISKYKEKWNILLVYDFYFLVQVFLLHRMLKVSNIFLFYFIFVREFLDTKGIR